MKADQKLRNLLKEINLEKYANQLLKHNFNAENIYKLMESDLNEIGISKVGDRKNLIGFIDKKYWFKRVFIKIQKYSSIISLISTVIITLIAFISLFISQDSVELAENNLRVLQNQIEFAYKPDLIICEDNWEIQYVPKGRNLWKFVFSKEAFNEMPSTDPIFLNEPAKLKIKNIGEFSARNVKVEYFTEANIDELITFLSSNGISVKKEKFLNPLLELNFQTSLLDFEYESREYSRIQFIKNGDDGHSLFVPKRIYEYLYTLMLIEVQKNEVVEWAEKLPRIWDFSPRLFVKIDYKNMYGEPYNQFYFITFKLLRVLGAGGFDTDSSKSSNLNQNQKFIFGLIVDDIDSLQYSDAQNGN